MERSDTNKAAYLAVWAAAHGAVLAFIAQAHPSLGFESVLSPKGVFIVLALCGLMCGVCLLCSLELWNNWFAYLQCLEARRVPARFTAHFLLWALSDARVADASAEATDEPGEHLPWDHTQDPMGKSNAKPSEDKPTPKPAEGWWKGFARRIVTRLRGAYRLGFAICFASAAFWAACMVLFALVSGMAWPRLGAVTGALAAGGFAGVAALAIDAPRIKTADTYREMRLDAVGKGGGTDGGGNGGGKPPGPEDKRNVNVVDANKAKASPEEPSVTGSSERS